RRDRAPGGRPGPPADADRPPHAGVAPRRLRRRERRLESHSRAAETARPARPLLRRQSFVHVTAARGVRRRAKPSAPRRPGGGTSRRGREHAIDRAKSLKRLEMTMGAPCQKLAWIWDRRRIGLGSAPFRFGGGARVGTRARPQQGAVDDRASGSPTSPQNASEKANRDRFQRLNL